MKKEINSRTKKRKQSKRNHLLGLILLSLGLFSLLILGLHFLNAQKQQTATSASSSTVITNESSTASSSETLITQDKENIEWIPQTEPVKVAILMYHGVHVMAPSEASNANNIVDPAVFESQLKAMKEAGYYSLTPEEAYKVLTENVLPNNQKVVWLTFDDSIIDFYTVAFPILSQYGMKATNNTITGFVQDEIPGSLTLPLILEMQQAGMSFQSHTVSHPSLADSTAESQQYELSESKLYLDTNLKQDTIAVAYPSGRYTETTLSIVQSLGYKLGVTTNNGLASASDGLLSLNRIRVLPSSTPDVLLAEMAY